MKAVLIFVLCFAWHCGIIARAEDVPTDRVDSSTKESDLIALKAVIAALPKWSSGSGPESFQFERCIDAVVSTPEEKQIGFSRTICSHCQNADFIFGLEGFQPAWLFSGNTTFCFIDSEWTRSSHTWLCQAKEPFPANFLDMNCNVPPDGPIIMDLPRYISEDVSVPPLQIIRDRVTDAFVFIKKNKSWIEIRQRSPNDAEQLGCVLSEIMIAPMRLDRGMPNGRMSLRSFMTSELKGVRLRVDDEKMGLVVDAGPASDQVFVAMRSLPLSAWFFAFEDSASNTNLGLPMYLAAKRTELSESESGDNALQRWNLLRPRFNEVIAEIRSLQRKVFNESAEKQTLWFDDPVIRWRTNEKMGWKTMTGMAVTDLPLIVSYAGESDIDAIYAFLDAVSDFGTPDCSMECTLTRDLLSQHMPGQELFIETIFRSRHMYHVEPEEIDATVAALVYSKPSSEMERVAVETLLRLDEYDRVPPESWQRWWDSEVVKADKVFRWDTLSMLSLHPGNRAVLMAQLPQAAAPLNHEIWKNLKLRAESTQRTRRWDFMTEAECEQILALPAPSTPGKDTEGGPARPFPTDE